MSKIAKVWARQILDSRGNPTLECVCQLDSGRVSVASVPSGVSTGEHEALELRDNDETRYLGQGVTKAIEIVNNTLGPAIVGMDPMKQQEIDAKLIALDGTENKSKLGANSILSVSISVAKAGASSAKMQPYRWIQELARGAGIRVDAFKMPTPVAVVIEGGLHGAGNLDFQEFFVIPATSKSFKEGLRSVVEVYHTLKQNLERRGAIHSVGDEGAFAPNLFTNADALEVLVETIKQTNYSIGRDIFLGLDVAASVFYKNGHYNIRDKSSPLDENTMIEYYKVLNDQYRMEILEDPLAENSWAAWSKLTEKLGKNVTIVGDDLLATNIKRVEKAIAEKACNAILVKPNQIGTISETLKVIARTKSVGWKIIISHRGGETNDWFIADFAVGIGAEYVKFGAPARGERVAKYNRLSSIDIELAAPLT